MKFTRINEISANVIADLRKKNPDIIKIVKEIENCGGRVLLVGGAVRDAYLEELQKTSRKKMNGKDLDIEVHGISLDQLQSILSRYGNVSLVGKSFGVLKVHGINADWSLPRTDSKGRKPTVEIDPHMKIKDAFSRRDLTINALGIDLVTGELIDPFNGLDDLEKGTLRAPDLKKFSEDPLRLFRVMQFISRFDMMPDKQLDRLCKQMDIKKVSRERIEQEFKKMLLQSDRPSLGIRWLKESGRLQEIFPELAALIDVPQSPIHHPEGDVFEHTMQALDAAAQITYENDYQRLIGLYAALCHDLGKATATEFLKGDWRAYGHEHEGVAPTKRLLKRITHEKRIIDSVAKLVKYHMVPYQLVQSDASLRSYKRLARKLAPEVNLIMLANLGRADKRGRNPKSHEPLTKKMEEMDVFMSRAEKASVAEYPEPPVLTGKDLKGFIEPGPQMGELLRDAYELQINEGITNKEMLKQRILKR